MIMIEMYALKPSIVMTAESFSIIIQDFMMIHSFCCWALLALLLDRMLLVEPSDGPDAEEMAEAVALATVLLSCFALRFLRVLMYLEEGSFSLRLVLFD